MHRADCAVGPDNERFGHANDAKLKRKAPFWILPDSAERIAEPIQKLHGCGGAVFVGDAEDFHAARL